MIRCKKATSICKSLVWPSNCCYTGVIVASIVEKLTRPPTASDSTAVEQSSGQPTQTFGESLRAATKLFSDANSAEEGSSQATRPQKSNPTDVNTAVLSPKQHPPKELLQQQPSGINAIIHSILAPSQLPAGVPLPPLHVPAVADGGTSDDGAAGPFSGIESASAELGADPSVIGALQASTVSTSKQRGTEASSVTVSQAANTPSHGIASGIASAAPASPADAIASGLQNAQGVQSPIANLVTNVVADSSSSAIPNGSADVSAGADGSAGRSSDADAVQNSTENAARNGIATTLLNAGPATVPHAPTSPSSNIVSGVSIGYAANTVPNAFPAAAHATVVKAVPNSLPNAVSNEIANGAGPVPIAHTAASASAKQNAAPAAIPVSNGPAISPESAPNQSALITVLNGPGAPANQLVALLQPGLASRVILAAGVLSPSAAATGKLLATDAGNTKDAIKDATKGGTNLATGLNSAASSASAQGGSQGTSQSGEQGQAGNSAQGQNAAPAQINFASHPGFAIDPTQSAPILSPLQTAPILAGNAGHTGNAPDAATSASTVVPQPPPVVNTAKLIQSAGQSELRVGIRSDEFGNISIRTSSTRETLSAQILLDHGELARALAAHLPEIQARLGGNQALDVRIDTSGSGTGQGAGHGAGQGQGGFAGTSNGTTNGSTTGDGSHGDRQQRGSTATTQSVGLVERQLPSTGLEERVSARLDLRA